ncbi:MAG: hypothetical protein QM483_04280 [Desulfuromusa sp.]
MTSICFRIFPCCFSGFRGRLQNIEPLLHRLFDRPDQLVRDIVSEAERMEGAENQSAVIFDRRALITSAFGLLIVFSLWQI